MRVWPGSPSPLGATWDGEGTQLRRSSRRTRTAVELCLFNHPMTRREPSGSALSERTDQVWHAYLPDVRPGPALRLSGAWPVCPRRRPSLQSGQAAARSLRARRIERHDPAGAMPLCGYRGPAATRTRDLALDPHDSAGVMPKCIVVDPPSTGATTGRPRTPWNRTVIYECHVKGMTMLHPDVPEALRGTYLGLATDPVIDHLHGLGVTAVELLPVHHVVDRAAAGTSWASPTTGATARSASSRPTSATPRRRPAATGRRVQVHGEAAPRAPGIEVILDVVYNHTAEGDHLGPTLVVPRHRQRGLLSPGSGQPAPLRRLHRLRQHARSARTRGRAAGAGQPALLGRRRCTSMAFASTWRRSLARGRLEVDRRRPTSSTSFGRTRCFRQVKLIAEPWDLGPGRLPGRPLPAPVGRSGTASTATPCGVLARRRRAGGRARVAPRRQQRPLRGQRPRRRYASINFVTCHDGFTLHDLVSYERKHNEANGEDNRDGSDDNLSRNWGVEGPTEAAHVRADARARSSANLLATLAFSQGVPMMSHGDEIGRTQQGNNNAYCQDSPLTWVDWRLTPLQKQLLRVHPHGLRHPGRAIRCSAGARSFRPRAGRDRERQGPDLAARRRRGDDAATTGTTPRTHVLGMLIRGEATDEIDERGRRLIGEAILLLLNGGARSRPFTLPALDQPGSWAEVINTAHPRTAPGPSERVNLVAHSLMLLRHEAPR